MRPTLVILVVGLWPRHIGPDTPNISALARAGGFRPLATVMSAVTGTVQATFLTGALPREHGIVADGWLLAISWRCGSGGSRIGWSRAR